MSDATRPPAPPLRSRTKLRAWLQARSATLAIDALPPALAALKPAAVHVVYADPGPACDALFWHSAARLLRARTTVLSPRAGPDIANMLRAHGLDIHRSRTLHTRANVCTLRSVPNRSGIEVLVDALQAILDQCGARGSQFLVEGAQAFLRWDDSVALADDGDRLAQWCAASGCGVLLMIEPPGGAAALQLASLAGFHRHFAGVARLAQQHGQLVWEVGFWRHKEALLPQEVVPLRFSPADCSLVASSDAGEKIRPDETPSLLALDENHIIVSRDAVMRERWVPPNWLIVNNNDDAVASASGAVAATVILHYGQIAKLKTLANQIHQLRRDCGKALKIVVREDHEVLRQRYELLMLTLGANLVIHRNTPFARVQTMLAEIQGQMFSRPVLPDLKSALSAAVAIAATGYVPPGDFISLVRTTLERSSVIRLPHMLLELPLLPEVAHVDALRACQMHDAGDLCTASSNAVYAFFFACRLENVETACRHVFTRPMSELFGGELRCGDPASIMAALKRLEGDISQCSAQDYSGWLTSHAESLPVAMEATLPPDEAPIPLPATTRARRKCRVQPQTFAIPLKPNR
ncbi:cellulose biosynthesis protein BcsE [Cupriavidus necator]